MADVHYNIEQRNGDAAHHLSLRLRSALDRQALNRALPDAERFIVLHEGGIACMPGKKVGSEGFREIASLFGDVADCQLFQVRYVKDFNFIT